MNEIEKKIFCRELNWMLKGNSYWTLQRLKEKYRDEPEVLNYLKNYET